MEQHEKLILALRIDLDLARISLQWALSSLVEERAAHRIAAEKIEELAAENASLRAAMAANDTGNDNAES